MIQQNHRLRHIGLIYILSRCPVLHNLFKHLAIFSVHLPTVGPRQACTYPFCTVWFFLFYFSHYGIWLFASASKKTKKRKKEKKASKHLLVSLVNFIRCWIQNPMISNITFIKCSGLLTHYQMLSFQMSCESIWLHFISLDLNTP